MLLLQTSMMNFYISKQWINRFNTFAEPGPITNYDFLCRHGGKQVQTDYTYCGRLILRTLMKSMSVR